MAATAELEQTNQLVRQIVEKETSAIKRGSEVVRQAAGTTGTDVTAAVNNLLQQLNFAEATVNEEKATSALGKPAPEQTPREAQVLLDPRVKQTLQQVFEDLHQLNNDGSFKTDLGLLQCMYYQGMQTQNQKLWKRILDGHGVMEQYLPNIFATFLDKAPPALRDAVFKASLSSPGIGTVHFTDLLNFYKTEGKSLSKLQSDFLKVIDGLPAVDKQSLVTSLYDTQKAFNVPQILAKYPDLTKMMWNYREYLIMFERRYGSWNGLLENIRNLIVVYYKNPFKPA